MGTGHILREAVIAELVSALFSTSQVLMNEGKEEEK
jgi:hypothetical protein